MDLSWLGGINTLELALAVTFVLMAWVYFRPMPNAWERAVALAIVALVAVLTAAEATQFMTADERGISLQLLTHDQRAVRQLELGAFKSGAILALPTVRVLELAGATPEAIRMALKALWWLAGNLIVFMQAIVVTRVAIGKAATPSFFVAPAFASLALLPTTQLAMKTVNYDLISSELAALSVLVAIVGALEKSWRAAPVALVLGAIAAQEKLTASPFLICLMVAMSVTYGLSATDRIAAARRAASTAALSILGCAAVFLFSAFLYVLLAWPAGKPQLWSAALDPFGSWSWALLTLIVPIASILDTRMLISIASIACIIIVAAAIGYLAPELTRVTSAFTRRRCVGPVIIAIVLAVLFIIGSAGALSIIGYWAPFHPSPLDGSILAQSLNGISLHVDATTIPGHMAGLAWYALAVVVVAIPSAIWAGSIAGVLYLRTSGSDSLCGIFAAVAGLIAIGIGFPLLVALTGTPFAHRYFNISLVLLAAGMIIPEILALDRLRQSRTAAMALALAAVFSLALVAEAAPFRPLFAAFRPFWLTYDDAARAEPGRLNPSWMDWGESVMLGGKKLEQACLTEKLAVARENCGYITLYLLPNGLWLPGPQSIHLKPWPRRGSQFNATDTDFYLFSRLRLIQSKRPMPDIEPDFVVEHRGYVLGWIFRGDRLSASGYDPRQP